MVKAVFQFREHKVIIRLKEKYLKQANDSISKGKSFLPVSFEMYRKVVRQNGLEYWLEWDRHKVFEYRQKNLS